MNRKTTTLCAMMVLATVTLASPTENTYHAVGLQFAGTLDGTWKFYFRDQFLPYQTAADLQQHEKSYIAQKLIDCDFVLKAICDNGLW